MEDNGRTERLTPIAVDWVWRDRVRRELEGQKAWVGNFGYLVREHPDNMPHGDALDRFVTTIQQRSPNLKERHRADQAIETGRPKRDLESDDSVKDFVDHYIRTHMKLAPRQGPKDQFTKPVVTSQTYGWGQSLERFGRLKAF